MPERHLGPEVSPLGLAPPSAATAAEAAVLDLIGTEEITSLAAALVVAPGENPPGQEQATVEVLARACDQRGLDHEIDPVRPGRPNLRARLAGGDGPGLLFLGHSDVVPAGDGWSMHPHRGLVRDGRLYGRGSADMKGGLAAMLVALGAMRRAGVPLRGPVELAVTIDEEDAALGVRHYLTSGHGRGFAGCVVGEPTGLQTVIAARGDAYLEIKITGRAAHAGSPDEGTNAIYGAAEIIDDLRCWHAELAGSGHPLTGPATVSVGTISGGTGPSIVPAECRLIADRRLLPTETGPMVLDQLRRRIGRLDLPDDLRIETELILDMPGFETANDSTIATVVHDSCIAAGAPELPPGGWSAACDGGFLARDAGLDVVVFGPGSVTEQAHQADESVPIRDLLTAARGYALIIQRTLGIS
ncbi:M20 family metallopeptidase [Microlunatus elymi]|uniref:M20 family metallopeptidase n=1 Tax=Microlunatus elymi TaxID=2596828 RepID=A0A516Q181_9ACTN|nr:M20 family metallopeptidase [Microlunatus elymi]QDP97193.1 M20 family metallopeptidase [Microlunatus elymi]